MKLLIEVPDGPTPDECSRECQHATLWGPTREGLDCKLFHAYNIGFVPTSNSATILTRCLACKAAEQAAKEKR